MSTTYPTWDLTKYPNALDKTNVNIRQGIINFSDRVSSNDADYHLNYTILANDVKALQQSIFAVEEVIGVSPQRTFGTVDARIADLEDYSDLYDIFGGVGWQVAGSPTIMGHLHNGTQAQKIDLRSQVTYKLSSTNINLDRVTVGALTADLICLSATTDQTIASRFADKLDKVGGTISGNLAVSGQLNSMITKEVESKDGISSSTPTGTNVSDAGTNSGIARRGTPTDASGIIFTYASQLRYGDYSVGLRLKLSDASSTLSIGKFRVYSGQTLVSTSEIIPSKLEPINPADLTQGADYQTIYAPLVHKVRDGVVDKNVTVRVDWYGSSLVPAIPCTMYMDSVVITPVNIAVYYKTNS